MNNLQRAKEEAREKFTAENNNNLWTTATEQIEEINPLLDEIVTSTYRQAQIDISELAEEIIKYVRYVEEKIDGEWGECRDWEELEKLGRFPVFYDKLQSLKQTKDV